MSHSSSCAFSSSADHLASSEQICYARCTFCNTVLAVSVPCSSFMKSHVTVRCGHCTNLLAVANIMLFTPHNFHSQNLLLQEQICNSPSNYEPNYPDESRILPAVRQVQETHKPALFINRPPEKRQRAPSAYNRFIKDEIRRIKAANPDLSHREAFSAAAKNWAHYPNIQFGLMSNQPVKKARIMHQLQE